MSKSALALGARPEAPESCAMGGGVSPGVQLRLRPSLTEVLGGVLGSLAKSGSGSGTPAPACISPAIRVCEAPAASPMYPVPANITGGSPSVTHSAARALNAPRPRPASGPFRPSAGLRDRIPRFLTGRRRRPARGPGILESRFCHSRVHQPIKRSSPVVGWSVRQQLPWCSARRTHERQRPARGSGAHGGCRGELDAVPT